MIGPFERSEGGTVRCSYRLLYEYIAIMLGRESHDSSIARFYRNLDKWVTGADMIGTWVTVCGAR